jgi:tetratricopeptide (TPR) repeat protein
MGVVYAAYDPELDRKIAIKLVRAALGNQGRERLLREAQAMARLSHPNVIAVHDVGTVDDEVFIAMELVDGAPLSTVLKEQRPGLEEVLSFFLQAGRGLAAAHAAGIIHRDFKPDNVLIGKDGRVRVLDFGLARAAEAQASEAKVEVTGETEISGRQLLDTPLTRTGAFMGTPAYMAPEQILSKPTDARSDQFSFCVALYEAIYGERPFVGDTVVALAEDALRGDVRPAPRNSPVPARLRNVVLRGLSGSPERRFPSMEALLEALAPREKPRSPAWFVALGVVLLGAGLLGFRFARRQTMTLCRGAESRLAGVWDAQRKAAVHAAFTATGRPFAEDAFHGAERALDAHAAAWAGMHTEACEATRVRGEQSEELLDLRMECLSGRREEMRALVDLFTHADAQVVQKAVGAASSLGGLDGCADAAALRAPVRPPKDPAKRARVDELRKRLAVVKALGEAGKYGDALTIARPLVEEARALGYAPIQAEALFRLGRALRNVGKYQESEEALFEAAAEAMAGRDETVAAPAWRSLIEVVGIDQARAADGHRWALFAEAATGSAESEERARFHTARGGLLSVEQRPEEALVEYRRALAIEEKLAPESPTLAGTLGMIGAAFADEGRPDEALKEERRALAILERTLGPEHPDVAKTLNNIAVALETQGLYDDALAQYRRALEIDERTLGPEHHVVGVLLGNIGDVLVQLHRYDEALAPSRRSLAIVEKAMGPNHPDLGYSLGSIGAALLGLHTADQAIAPLERALAVWAHGGSTPKDVAQVRFDLARASWETGERSRARKLAEAARDEYRQAGPAAAKSVAEVEIWLAHHQAR